LVCQQNWFAALHQACRNNNDIISAIITIAIAIIIVIIIINIIVLIRISSKDFGRILNR
jgi:hypothetical protein